MPITSVIILAAIVSAFVLFGVVLAWGEHQTRHLAPSAPRRVGGSGKIRVPTMVKTEIAAGNREAQRTSDSVPERVH